MGNPYRDGAGTLEERLAALDQAIAEREAFFSEDFWKLAAPGLGLAPPEAGKKRRKRGAEEPDLAGRVAARQERLDRLEGAAARLDQIEASLCEPPPTTPACERKTYEIQTGVLFTPPEGPAAREGFVRIAESLAPGGLLEEVGTYAMKLAFARGTAPITAMCDAGFVFTGQNSQSFTVRMVAQTSVSPLSGQLDVRPQGIGDEVLGIFGLRKEHTLGHADFDGMFFVRGDEAAARTLLAKETRDALLVIAREAVPSLTVVDGLARLEWRYEPRLAAVEAAFDILAALREAEPTRSLRAATGA